MRKRKAKILYEITCEVCGLKFEAETKNRRMHIACRQKLAAKSSNANRNYGTADCPVCKKEFEKKAPHARYCSESCKKRANYLNNIDYHRAYDRSKKIPKVRIGLNIRDETLGTPSKHAKWLWDGLGKWSVKYWPDIQECLECNTTVYRHGANGVCERCYSLMKSRDPEKVKEWKRKSYEKRKAKGALSQQQSRDWIEKAKKKRIPITPKIENLLDNLERL